MNTDSGPNEGSDDLDSVVSGAVDGLSGHLLGVDVPAFSPTPRRSPALALVLILLGMGAFAFNLVGETADDGVRISTPAGDPTQAPEPRNTVTDATFGAELTRVTNGVAGEFVMPLASAWNADATRLLLYRTDTDGGGRHQVYDAETFELLVELDIRPVDIEQVYWDPANPDELIFIEDLALSRLDTASGERRFVVIFDECISVMSSASALSWDGQLFVALCEGDDGWGNLVYRFGTGVTKTGWISDSGSQSEAPAMPRALASGAGFLASTEQDDIRSWQAFDPDHQPLSSAAISTNAALSTALAADGSDIVVGPSYDGDLVGSLVMWDPFTGKGSVILGPSTGFAYPASGTQVSTQSWDGSGRIALSILGDGSPEGELAGEVLAITVASVGQSGAEIAESLRRLANHHSSGETQASDYWATVFVSLSPDGQRLLFSSDWQSSQQVDTYVVAIDL